MISAANKTERLDQSSRNGDFRVGDRVRIRPGTLTWRGEPMLRKHVGVVITSYRDEGGTARITVEFPFRRLLPRREASVFLLVERQYGDDLNPGAQERRLTKAPSWRLNPYG